MDAVEQNVTQGLVTEAESAFWTDARKCSDQRRRHDRAPADVSRRDGRLPPGDNPSRQSAGRRIGSMNSGDIHGAAAGSRWQSLRCGD